MRLNLFETLLMNNPVRAASHRYFESRRLLSMGGTVQGQGLALEVGCGRGVGATLILDRFNARHVDAFDLDPRMVGRAAKRTASRPVRLWVGDATDIPVADQSYDAVFDFGIIHHIPCWRNAVSEIFRVLRPGGKFYAEEILRHFILHPLWGRWFDHPRDDRFDHADFITALEDQGFDLVAERKLFRLAGFYFAVRP